MNSICATLRAVVRSQPIKHVIVVGAGAAGLAAATRLRAAGLHVSVVERAAHPGGCLSVASEADFSAPVAGQVVASTSRVLLAWAREQAAAVGRVSLERAVLTQVHRCRLERVRGRRLGMLARAPGIRLDQSLRLLRLERLLRSFAPLLELSHPERGARLDDRSLADFGRLYFGAPSLRRVLVPALLSTAPCLPEETSRMLWLLHAANAQGAPEDIAVLHGAEFAAALASPLAVEYGVEITAVERDDRAVYRVCGKWREHRAAVRSGSLSRAEWYADAVVLATPAPVAAALAAPWLKEVEREFLRGAPYLPALAVVLRAAGSLGERFSLVRNSHQAVTAAAYLHDLAARPDKKFGLVRFPEGEDCILARLTWESAITAQASVSPETVAVAIPTPAWASAHFDAPDATIIRCVLAQLELLQSGFTARVRRACVQRYRPGAPHFPVGRYRELQRFRRLECESRAEGRRLYFAGDYLAGPFLEAALHTGLRAADDLLADAAAVV